MQSIIQSCFFGEFMFLCPNDICGVAMTCMGWVCHPANVATNDMVDILPTFGVMGGNVEATIENLEPVNSRLGCCYNELHNVFFCFVVKLCFLASHEHFAQKRNLQAVNLTLDGEGCQPSGWKFCPKAVDFY